APALQHHRGPEGTDLRKMRLPVDDTGGKDRPEQGIAADLGIEGPHEPLDHRLVDAGLGGAVDGRARAPLGFGHGCSAEMSTAGTISMAVLMQNPGPASAHGVSLPLQASQNNIWAPVVTARPP